MFKHFRLEDGAERSSQACWTLWIDVAERSVNVLTEEVFEELRRVVQYTRLQSPARPLVLRSAKTKGFSVGADLRRIAMMRGPLEVHDFLEAGQQVLEYLEQSDQITVAVLEGACLGGGLEVALACRYRIAVESAATRIGMPEVLLGLMPGWGGTQRLIETVGVEVGLDLLLSGRFVDARQAFDWGLIDAIAFQDQLSDSITQLLTKIEAGLATGRPPVRDACAAAEPSVQRAVQGIALSADDAVPWKEAIVTAVRRGCLESRAAGFEAERKLFHSLLAAPRVQEELQKRWRPST